jgi:hypothetical protein
VPPKGLLREIPQKLQKLAARGSLANGDVGRKEPVPVERQKHVCLRDVVQHVNGTLGQAAGVILWEFKNTKNWSDGWLSKLRE